MMKSIQYDSQKPWANAVYAITLFVEDTGRTRSFYEEKIALQKFFDDDNSVVFKIGSLLLNF